MKSLIIAAMLLVPALSLFAQGQVTMYEGNRNTTGNGGAIIFPSLPTTPASVAWSGGPAIISPGSLQSPSLVIQSVPEPSSVAMIALGILAGVSILRRSQIRRATLN